MLQCAHLYSIITHPGLRLRSAAAAGQCGIEDYQHISCTPLCYNNTQRPQTLTVIIFDDGVPEGVQELNVTLTLQDPNLANQVMVEPAVATVTIRDNDSEFDWWFQGEEILVFVRRKT